LILGRTVFDLEVPKPLRLVVMAATPATTIIMAQQPTVTGCTATRIISSWTFPTSIFPSAAPWIRRIVGWRWPDQLCGAKRYERSADRIDGRAGSYDRKLQTKAGEVH